VSKRLLPLLKHTVVFSYDPNANTKSRETNNLFFVSANDWTGELQLQNLVVWLTKGDLNS